MKYVSPSVKETAFNCPHCGALAMQRWWLLCALPTSEKKRLPIVISPENRGEVNFEHIEDAEDREKLFQWVEKMANGRPFFGERKGEYYANFLLHNTFVSECFNCKDISIWTHDKLIWPQRGEAPPANPDLPDDIRRDYDEASSILDLSPRGSAALIRLAIQKLCKELGKSGKTLNDDIGELVKDGLDQRAQMALDAVRVIGNNAVHPGQVDLRDDRATAETLFKLLNLIAEKTMSEPKHVEEVYATLPEDALKAIEKRDSNNYPERVQTLVEAVHRESRR